MIQAFWLVDFIGLFLGRLILSLFLILEARRQNKFFSFLYLILSAFIFFGYYSSFAFIFLIFLEIFFLIEKIVFRKESIFQQENHFLRLALAIVYLFVGPGLLSADRIFNLRF